MRQISCHVVDFWCGYDDCFIIKILKQYFDVVQDSKNPQFLFYSAFGYEHLGYKNSIRIFYTGENMRPNFQICDYAITFDFLDYGDRHLRFPGYAVRYASSNFKEHAFYNFDERYSAPATRGFASMVVSNQWAKERLDFFDALNKYKKVHSGGRALNNIGNPVSDKIEFVNKYKFNICFENSSYEGYVTEKLVDALYARALPIYFGDTKAKVHINPDAFINVHDFKDFNSVISLIRQIDSNPSLYDKYLQAPPFNDPNHLDNLHKSLHDFLLYIIEHGKIFSSSYDNHAENLLFKGVNIKNTQEEILKHTSFFTFLSKYKLFTQILPFAFRIRHKLIGFFGSIIRKV